jgi:hypothetical protein
VTFIVGSIAVIVPTPNGAAHGISRQDHAHPLRRGHQRRLFFVLIVHSVQTLLVVLLGIYGWLALSFTRKSLFNL